MKDATQETIAAPEVPAAESDFEAAAPYETFTGSAEYQSTKSDWLQCLQRNTAKKTKP